MKREPDWIAALTDQSRIMGSSRVFRDDQAFTLEEAGEVIRRLLERLDRVKRSRDWAATAMGMMPGKLSGAINGTLENPETIIRTIDKWLETEHLRETASRPAGFVKTAVAEQIFAVARYCLESAGIALVHGPAGIGKSFAAAAIRAETPGAIYISIRTAGQTAMAVMEQISAALRLHEKPTRARLFGAIEGVLRETGRLLIVDEIHKLEGRRHDEALHCLRDLHDATGIPMLWLGMSNLATYIHAGHAKGYEPLDQIYSRIGLWLDLTQAAERTDGGPGLATIEDIRAMLAARQIRMTPDGEGYLLMLASEFGAGAFRSVDKLLQFAVKLARGEVITAEMLRGIQARRLGMRAVSALESRMAMRVAKVSA